MGVCQSLQAVEPRSSDPVDASTTSSVEPRSSEAVDASTTSSQAEDLRSVLEQMGEMRTLLEALQKANQSNQPSALPDMTPGIPRHPSSQYNYSTPSRVRSGSGSHSDRPTPGSEKSHGSNKTTFSSKTHLSKSSHGSDQSNPDVAQELKKIKQLFRAMDLRTSSLSEDQARKQANRDVGGDFATPYTMRSLHHAVELVANGDWEGLPLDDMDARNNAVQRLVTLLGTLFPSVAKAAVLAVDAAAQQYAAIFTSDVYDEAKAQFAKNALDIISKASDMSSLHGLDWKSILGNTIRFVQVLSGRRRDGEAKKDRKTRLKVMNNQFKSKLIRLKETISVGYSSCEGAGIMILAAISAAPEEVWTGTPHEMSKWIEEKCNPFKFKEVIQCDLTPRVQFAMDPNRPGHSVTITVGEIKANTNHYQSGRDQMVYTASVLHFVLLHVIKMKKGHFSTVYKHGNLYFLQPKPVKGRHYAKHQGMSINKHYCH
ncbi:MAG: hypothetical protein SGILL_006042 [Bacillariaceae sp.]